MVTLKESLLSSTSKKVSLAKNIVGAFGDKYKITSFYTYYELYDMIEAGYINIEKLNKLTQGKSFINIDPNYNVNDNLKHRPEFDSILKLAMWIENLVCTPFESLDDMTKFLQTAFKEITRKKIVVNYKNWTLSGRIQLYINWKSRRMTQLGTITLDRDSVYRYMNESLLSQTKDKVTKTKDVFNKMLFIDNYELIRCHTGEPIKSINLKRIKELNVDKTASDKGMSKMSHIKDERFIELIKYIENLNLIELGFPEFDCTDLGEMKDFVAAVENEMKKDGIFIRPNSIFLKGYQDYVDKDEFDIVFQRNRNPMLSMSFIFKKKKIM